MADNEFLSLFSFLEIIPDTLVQWYHNFFRNLFGMWDGMTIFKYIRLVAIVGAYFLLRPYLEKLAAKMQTKQHEKELDPYEMAAALSTKDGKKEKLVSPNALRGAGGAKVMFEESESEEDEGKATGGDVKWGKKAMKRQRRQIKRVFEAEEESRREDDEEDIKDIKDLLVDYEEGVDGW